METLLNYIDGGFCPAKATETVDVINPATASVLARAPFSSAEDVHRAAETAAKAFYAWRRTPVGERIQPLFKLKSLLEAHRDELALSITDECGKTLSESSGELQRSIENVETACGMPMQIQGQVTGGRGAGNR